MKNKEGKELTITEFARMGGKANAVKNKADMKRRSQVALEAKIAKYGGMEGYKEEMRRMAKLRWKDKSK